MAPKGGRKFKTKAKKTSASSFALTQFDRVRFSSTRNEEIFESLTQYRSIWGERKIVLDELDPSIHRSLESRNWLSLCDDSHPPLTTLIREFYSNLFINSNDFGGHYLST